MQLYINDQLVDLTDDSPIALSFQINNLAEVKNQQGNTSNQFKLPLTQRNRQILGFPDEVALTAEHPYRKYQAKIIQDGLEIIPFGTAELNGVDNSTASITVLSGNVDFFDAIDGKFYDMGDSLSPYGLSKPFSTYNHYWTLDNVISSQQKTEGWIWPVIDYGALAYNQDSNPVIDVRQLRPGFFLKSAIDMMVKSTGFKARGALLDDPLYQKLIVQFANDSFEHGTDYQNALNNFSVTARKTMNQELSKWQNNDSDYGEVSFSDTSGSDPSGSFNHAFNAYIAKETVTLNVQFKYNILVTDISKGGEQPYINLQIRKFSPSTGQVSAMAEIRNMAGEDASNPLFGGTRDGAPQYHTKQSLSQDLVLQPGESVRIGYWLYPNKNRVKAVIDAGAELIITNKKTDVAYGQQVQCERIFPDISQKDLLKDTLQRFGIICQTDSTNRTVTFASFRDIVNNIPKAKNWSAKCIDQGKSISFQLGGYAQVNYLKYKEDDGITPKTFGQSQIMVDDKTLPASADLFQSQFAPTLNRPYIAGTIAQILKIEEDDEDKELSISTEPRLLIDQKLNLMQNGKTISFTDGVQTRVVNDIVSTPYFDKPNGEHSLLFENLRKKYYPELEKILHRCKKVVRYFHLSTRDILELDLLIPVYLQQDGTYYYINKIDSWRKGQPTKVELVMLG